MTIWPKILAVAIAGLVVVVVGFYGWTRIARYDASLEAVAVAEGSERLRGWYVFAPAGAPTGGLVFYPGGLVDPAAYAPLMHRISEGGVLAVIVPMPLDLAVFGVGRAAAVIAAFPEVRSWAIGGHSLGGAMAAEFAARNASAIEGLVLLAAYPAQSTDLSGAPLWAVSIYGSDDRVASRDVLVESRARLPAETAMVVIDGGNHAQFGDYGPQSGDGTATIDREDQQRQTAAAVLEAMDHGR